MNESPLYEEGKNEDNTNSSRGNIFSSLLVKKDIYESQPDNSGPCTYVEVMYKDHLQNPVIVDQNVKKKKTNTSQSLIANDEGYNSHSSGESAPFLKAPVTSKQDEAGYEVPHNIVNAEKNLSSNKNKNKLSVSKFWQRYSYDFKETNKSEDQKHYYEPPSDSLHNYFLAQSRYPVIPFIVWLILSMAIASSLSLLLYLIVRIDLILSIVLSVIVFLLLLVMFVTLSIRHTLCIAALLVPSMFSSRAKLGVVMFIMLLLVIGPIVGINDKLNVARTCRNDRDLFKIEVVEFSETNEIYKRCTELFLRVYDFCKKNADFLRKSCLSKSLLDFETKICNQTDEYYCGSNIAVFEKCSMKTPMSYKPLILRFHSTIIISQIIIYIMPFLALLLFSEAYRYNKDYLTKKDEDNIYITPVLQSLDRERKNRGLNDFVVPLTRIEFQTYLIRKSFSLSRCEWLAIFKWLFVALGCGLLVLVVVFLDDWINRALENVLKLQCKYNFDYYLTKKYRNVIYAMLGFLAFLIVFQSYVLRLRSVICDYFYFDVVNIRSKHLYYKILHDRHSFARHVRRKVELMSEQKRLESKISFATKVFELLPQQVQGSCLKLTIRSCMVCDSLTYYKTVECKKLFCQAHYCFECFVDAGQCCLRCQNTDSNKPTSCSLISVAV